VRAIKVSGYKLASASTSRGNAALCSSNYLLLIVLYLAAGYTSAELLRTTESRCFKEVERALSDDDGAWRKRGETAERDRMLSAPAI